MSNFLSAAGTAWPVRLLTTDATFVMGFIHVTVSSSSTSSVRSMKTEVRCDIAGLD